MIINQTKPAPIKNVKTNKTFLARFGTNNNNISSFDNVNINPNSNNNESPIRMKCLNELPKTKVINNKKSNIEISPPLIKIKNKNLSESSQNEEISIISNHSSTNSNKDDELLFISSNKNCKSDKIIEDSTLAEQNHSEILTIYTSKEKYDNPNEIDKKTTTYFQETQVLTY
jgi:hypothetical protein